MSDVSVQHIGTLYSYNKEAQCFLNEIESVIIHIKGDLELIKNDSYTHVNRIQEALEEYQSDVEDIRMDIEDLNNQLSEQEDPQAKREILNEIQNRREELSDAKNKVQACRNDERHADELRQEIDNHILAVNSLLDLFRNSVIVDIKSSTDFIQRYINYLQNITTAI